MDPSEPLKTPNAETIRKLNDLHRKTLPLSGRTVITDGIEALGPEGIASVLTSVATFAQFNADNDPHQEHDFGAFDYNGETVFFKIDYYDKTMESGSEDPSDPSKTTRVLTIMLASEY